MTDDYANLRLEIVQLLGRLHACAMGEKLMAEMAKDVQAAEAHELAEDAYRFCIDELNKIING